MGLDMGISKEVIAEDELMYWRKAHQIREWFVNNLDNFQDEGNTPIKKEDLEKLIDVCQKILSNPKLAKELLPIPDDRPEKYDENYFQQISYTIEEAKKIVKDTDWENEKIYYWEWY